MDVFMGDWDRHAAQWHWLRFDEGGRRDWRAVPVDRDQAFARFDGVFPSIAEYYLKQFASFGDEYPAIDKLTFAARHTDRRFLVGLEEADWRDVTSNVVARLTDDAIAGAVRQLPPELYARDHARLERALRARRDAPPPRAPSTGCSPRSGRVRDGPGRPGHDPPISRRRGRPVAERPRSRHGPAARAAYSHRSFRAGETSEIRLYLLGGADAVVEEGEKNDAILVRVVRGDRGAAALARAAIAGRTGAGAPQSDDARAAVPDELHLRYERFRGWGTDWLVFPRLS